MPDSIKPGPSSRCYAAHSSLLVVDVQENLGAAMPAKVLTRVLRNSELLARSSDLLDVAVLRTEQYPRGLGPTHAILREALPPSTETFEKVSFSCCGADGFQDALDRINRSQVIIVGMEAHVCVLQTALDLSAAGLDVFVVEDAICSRRLENYQNALDRMRQTAITIVSAESVVFEWLESAGHKHFKAIQALLP
jgi:hypothetical protein